MPAPRIAVIGFGFSGLMVTAHLVRLAPAETTVYIVADSLDALGVAYGTENVQHLLNVPANRMGAFPDAIDGFSAWLETAEGAQARQRFGITAYSPTDFMPRMLYGAYLQSIWQQVQQDAAARTILLKLVESRATAITTRDGVAVLTQRGDAIAVDHAVLATGNENKPVLPELTHGVIQDPWAKGAFEGAHRWASPVALMGAGLTAVDVVLSLRSAGYTGEVVAFSRHGLMPQPHAAVNSIFAFDKEQLLAQPGVSALMRFVRKAVKGHHEWRPVVDALRPYTQTLWQRLAPAAQARFLARLLAVWNVYRHRMAPQIAAVIRTEIMQGTLRVLACKKSRTRMEGGDPVLTLVHDGVEEELRPSRIVNCTGPQLAVAKSASTVLKQAVADGVIEPHGTGLGIAVDPQLRAWGTAYPHLYAMGALATGQLLESTAVPELRGQALQVAQGIVSAA